MVFNLTPSNSAPSSVQSSRRNSICDERSEAVLDNYFTEMVSFDYLEFEDSDQTSSFEATAKEMMREQSTGSMTPHYDFDFKKPAGRSFVRTISGREGELMFEAQDEGERVGILKYSQTGETEVRASRTYYVAAEETFLQSLGPSTLEQPVFNIDDTGFLVFDPKDFINRVRAVESDFLDFEEVTSNYDKCCSSRPGRAGDQNSTGSFKKRDVSSSSLSSTSISEESIKHRESFLQEKRVRFTQSTIEFDEQRWERQIERTLKMNFDWESIMGDILISQPR